MVSGHQMVLRNRNDFLVPDFTSFGVLKKQLDKRADYMSASAGASEEMVSRSMESIHDTRTIKFMAPKEPQRTLVDVGHDIQMTFADGESSLIRLNKSNSKESVRPSSAYQANNSKVNKAYLAHSLQTK